MPPFYIGSTSERKILNGYRGSVSSKEYKNTWKKELKNNSQLFKTFIISKHHTREDAMKKELSLQLKLGVVKSELYVNKSLAVPDGFFGMDVSGELNPMYGKQRPDASERMRLKNPMSNSESLLKSVNSKIELRAAGLHKSTRNSEEALKKTSNRMKENNPSKRDRCCLICKKETTKSGITRCKKCKGEI